MKFKILLFTILTVFVFTDNTFAKGRLRELLGVKDKTPEKLTIQSSLTHTWQGALNGTETKNSDRISGLYDLDFYYYMPELADDENCDYMLFAVSTQASFGSGVRTSKVGSYFNLNHAAKGDQDFYVDKYFVEFTAMDRFLTFDIGKIDTKDFFDASAVANDEKTQFLALPFKNNSTIPFPDKGLAARFMIEFSDFVYVHAAVADAHAYKREAGFNTAFHGPDDYFSIAELGFRTKLNDLPGNYRFIAWYAPWDKPYKDGSGSYKQDDVGYALSFDQKVNDSTTAFFRYGWADNKVNNTEDFVSFGTQFAGIIEGRENDVFGIAFARGQRSQQGLADIYEPQIDLFETYYDIKINKSVTIAPSIQLVTHPGGLKDQSPATVLGLRCRMKF